MSDQYAYIVDFRSVGTGRRIGAVGWVGEWGEERRGGGGEVGLGGWGVGGGGWGRWTGAFEHHACK